MRVVMFYHSLVSDWNHGNAHFLRGVATELLDREHEVRVLEPADSWSRTNLVQAYGRRAIDSFHSAYPRLRSETYRLESIDLDEILDAADLVLVHEWNDRGLVSRIGRHRAASGRYVLLFHDTHHRSVTDTAMVSAADLDGYDGVLAFGDAIRDLYSTHGRAWTWHEAADTRMFFPRGGGRGAGELEERSGFSSLQPPVPSPPGDVVWIGNWGDGERTEEIEEFLITPVARLGLHAKVFGVRYPDHAIDRLAAAGIEYGGWLPNYLVPDVFARFKVTVHIPRRPYLEALPGIPTIRPFEALACGIPLVSARWSDAGGLFTAGEDFLVARNGDEMTRHLASLVEDADRRRVLSERGRATVLSRHTCGHRVDELLEICAEARSVRSAPLARTAALESMP